MNTEVDLLVSNDNIKALELEEKGKEQRSICCQNSVGMEVERIP